MTIYVEDNLCNYTMNTYNKSIPTQNLYSNNYNSAFEDTNNEDNDDVTVCSTGEAILAQIMGADFEK